MFSPRLISIPTHPWADAPRPGFRCGRRGALAAFTVLEAAVSGAIVTLFLTSLFALNSNMMRLLTSANEAATASQNLQTRVEQVRLSNWNQITNPTWVKTNLLGSLTDAAVNLPGLSETLTVTPRVPPSSSTAPTSLPAGFTVRREANGAVTVSPAGYATATLLQQEMLQVEISVDWPGWTRNRSRALTTVVSRWGISK